jgi:urease subunit alpha
MIIKGGFIVAAQMGDPNASIPTPQPVHYRYMFGAFGDAPRHTAVTFTSQAAIDADISSRFDVKRRFVSCRNTRTITKRNMIHNNYMPTITVDSQTYEVRADGDLLTCEPADWLPLAQLYSLF